MTSETIANNVSLGSRRRNRKLTTFSVRSKLSKTSDYDEAHLYTNVYQLTQGNNDKIMFQSSTPLLLFELSDSTMLKSFTDWDNGGLCKPHKDSKIKFGSAKLFFGDDEKAREYNKVLYVDQDVKKAQELWNK